MAGFIEARLHALKLDLPTPAVPAAAYVPTALVGTTLYVSGQLPMQNGKILYTGKVANAISMEDGIAAARLCALNILGQVKAACSGDLDRVERVVRLGGWVNCLAEFIEHPKIINGASELMLEIFGDAGKHARCAVGAPSLPFDAAVEVEAIFQLRF